jgi:hypothetical protein
LVLHHDCNIYLSHLLVVELVKIIEQTHEIEFLFWQLKNFFKVEPYNFVINHTLV